MTDSLPAVAPAQPEAAEPQSSLTPANLTRGFEIEAMMGTPEYWRDPALQTEYRALVRGELAGEAGPLAPADDGSVDVDMPTKGHEYDFSNLAIYDGATRDLVDIATRDLRDAGFGQARMHSLMQWALEQTSAPTEQAFRKWAADQGWSSRHVKHAIKCYRNMSR